MEELPPALTELAPLLGAERLASMLRILVYVTVGWLAARAVRAAVARIGGERLSPQYAMILSRASYYLVVGLVGASVLRELGLDLSVLLGAAGILTVAIGFASQTSASNLISGLFLLGERPFVVGDTIQIGATLGEVVSVDLMSVKLRTFDNLLVRVPNETLLKSEIRNLTHFPIRRIELPIGVAYGTDLSHARSVLVAAADAYTACLDEPRPIVLFTLFADSAMMLELRVWTATANVLTVRAELPERMKEALDAAGISIPFPQRTLTASAPIPVRVVPE